MQGIKMKSVLQSHGKTWASISWIMSVDHVNDSCSTQSSGTIVSMIELSSNKTDAQVDMIHTCSDHLFEMVNYQYTFWRPVHATKMSHMHGLQYIARDSLCKMNIVYCRCGILCVDLPLACACVSASLVGMYVCKCLAKWIIAIILYIMLCYCIQYWQATTTILVTWEISRILLNKESDKTMQIGDMNEHATNISVKLLQDLA